MALVTIKDLSAYLTVKESTLYSWVHNGTIPFHKLNGLIRFDLEEIKSWVEASKTSFNGFNWFSEEKNSAAGNR